MKSGLLSEPITKACSICHEQKAIESFGVDRRRPGGRKSACRECSRNQWKSWYTENREEKLEYGRRYYSDNQYILLERAKSDKHKVACKRWAQANPDKVRAKVLRHYYKDLDRSRKVNRAQRAVQRAIEVGTLIRQPCEVCGSLDSEGHHVDYGKPLEVQWLCPKHHKQEHARISKIEQWMRFCFTRLGWPRRILSECNGVSLSTVDRVLHNKLWRKAAKQHAHT